MPLVIAPLDQLSHSEDLQFLLSQTDWDLICDRAHINVGFFLWKRYQRDQTLEVR
jgi:hypothetical protein